MKMSKRLLAMLLAMATIFCFAAVGAAATGEELEPAADETTAFEVLEPAADKAAASEALTPAADAQLTQQQSTAEEEIAKAKKDMAFAEKMFVMHLADQMMIYSLKTSDNIIYHLTGILLEFFYPIFIKNWFAFIGRDSVNKEIAKFNEKYAEYGVEIKVATELYNGTSWGLISYAGMYEDGVLKTFVEELHALAKKYAYNEFVFYAVWDELRAFK